MRIKFFEVRDRATCVPVLAIRTEADGPVEAAFLGREGHPRDGVIMVRLADGRGCVDPYDWGDRTHAVAHAYIIDAFEHLLDGQVVDVRVILGEAATPAAPEVT